MEILRSPTNLNDYINSNPKRSLTNFAVFLAGGITGCPPWSDQAAELLGDVPNLLLFDPRRFDFDVNNTSMEEEQIGWEVRHLSIANAILFWFPKETLCPITLFELGKAIGQNRMFVVGCDPEYKRKNDLIHQLKFANSTTTVKFSLEETVEELKRKTKLWRI